MHLEVEILLNFDHFFMVYPEISVLNIDTATLIRCGWQCQVQVQDVIAVVECPVHILQLNGRVLAPLHPKVNLILYNYGHLIVTFNLDLCRVYSNPSPKSEEWWYPGCNSTNKFVFR